MKSAKDYIESAKTTLVLVGSPGTGKTTTSLMFPKPYIFNADNNLRGALAYLKSKGFEPDFTYDDYDKDDNGKPVDKRLQYAHMIKCIQAAGASDCETIIIDGATAVSEIIGYKCLSAGGLTIGDGINTIDATMRIQDWGVFSGLWRFLVQTVKSFNKHSVFICHVDIDKDEITGVQKEFIAIPGRFSKLISGYANEAWLAQLDTETRVNGKLETRRMIHTIPGLRQDKLGLKTTSNIGTTHALGAGFEATFEELQKRIASITADV